ncbi:hypothetical protein JZ751_016157 [Albula glossodonta]|uniref:Uncharacterized protein n=1 Tax=Albula glossodonta TaxID=121402 RepID=A0A8T2MUM4_9TELE|nr:hypothetical protein JZ751_016157 [Albula glossodonta]
MLYYKLKVPLTEGRVTVFLLLFNWPLVLSRHDGDRPDPAPLVSRIPGGLRSARALTTCPLACWEQAGSSIMLSSLSLARYAPVHKAHPPAAGPVRRAACDTCHTTSPWPCGPTARLFGKAAPRRAHAFTEIPIAAPARRSRDYPRTTQNAALFSSASVQMLT